MHLGESGYTGPTGSPGFPGELQEQLRSGLFFKHLFDFVGWLYKLGK